LVDYINKKTIINNQRNQKVCPCACDGWRDDWKIGGGGELEDQKIRRLENLKIRRLGNCKIGRL